MTQIAVILYFLSYCMEQLQLEPALETTEYGSVAVNSMNTFVHVWFLYVQNLKQNIIWKLEEEFLFSENADRICICCSLPIFHSSQLVQ